MEPCDFGDFSKCPTLIDDATFLAAGSDECHRAEVEAYYCCNFCPGGVFYPATGGCTPANEDSDTNGGRIAQALNWMVSFLSIAFFVIL